jgi:hypothetical protein
MYCVYVHYMFNVIHYILFLHYLVYKSNYIRYIKYLIGHYTFLIVIHYKQQIIVNNICMYVYIYILYPYIHTLFHLPLKTGSPFRYL